MGTDPVWINMLDITSKFYILTMFLIINLQTVLNVNVNVC
jgi:hypothetical protein